jgi:uncharacterized protein DUF6505
MKFLKAVRLDDSDARIYAAEGGAATDGEWVVSGGYAVCDLAGGHCRPRCHCDTTFVGVTSHGRCTVAEVADIEPATLAQLREQLAQHCIDDLGAPSREVAHRTAEEECAYTADLAAGFPADVWITVKRQSTPDGVGERYSVFKRLMIGAHKL